MFCSIVFLINIVYFVYKRLRFYISLPPSWRKTLNNALIYYSYNQSDNSLSVVSNNNIETALIEFGFAVQNVGNILNKTRKLSTSLFYTNFKITSLTWMYSNWPNYFNFKFIVEKPRKVYHQPQYMWYQLYRHTLG